MSVASNRSAQLEASGDRQSREPQVPDTRLQLMLLTCAYGFSAMLLSSLVASPLGIIASGIGAVGGVWLYRWHVGQGLRNGVPTLMGLGLVLFGLIGPAWLGRSWFVPYALGISATLVMIQSLTMGMTSLGVVLLVRSLSQSTRTLSMLEGLAVIAAICFRFAAHQNFHWGHPRFFADWAGIQGYELPTLFALLGLAALLTGLIAGMKPTSRRHTAMSVIAVLMLFGLLLWVGGKFLRNPTPEIAQTFGGPRIQSGSTTKNNSGDSNQSDSENSEAGKSNGDPSGAAEAGDTTPDASTSKTGEAAASGSKSDGGQVSSKPNEDPLPSAASQSNSPEPIAVVLLEKDIQPYEKAWYFRQTAVSLFNGKRLVTASESRFDDDIPSGFSNEEVLIGGIPLPENMHTIVPLVVNVIAEQPRPFSLPSMFEFAPMTNPDPEYFRQRYHATSCVLTNEVVGDETFDLYSNLCYFTKGHNEWDEAMLSHYTRSPDDPRYKELAESIVAERIHDVRYEELEDSAMLQALAIKRWLEKNTTYSLNPKFDDPSVNPAEQFLFGERHGYCVHIAHASVYLMRSLGIPSRIGIGYLVPAERSGKSSSILIQSTDAHAWPEIYLDNGGWIVVDASPEKIDPSTQIAPEPDPNFSKFLGDKARNKDQHQSRQQEQEYSRGFPLRMSHIPWIILIVIGVIYGVKIWIRWAPSFASEPDLVRVTQRALVLQLAEAGIQRQFGETRSEFGTRLAANYPEFTKLTDGHVRQTYGRGFHMERASCLSVQQQTEQRCRQATNWFRRFIGRLDPRFWVLVR